MRHPLDRNGSGRDGLNARRYEGVSAVRYQNAARRRVGLEALREIHVCAKKFARQFSRRTAGGEILVIHELLHSLGLGENPPTSAQITDRVRLRCG